MTMAEQRPQESGRPGASLGVFRKADVTGPMGHARVRGRPPPAFAVRQPAPVRRRGPINPVDSIVPHTITSPQPTIHGVTASCRNTAP